MPPGEYVVLLKQFDLSGSTILAGAAEALATILGITRIDATVSARKAGGILLEGVDRQTAADLVAALAQRQVIALMAEAAALNAMGRPRTIRDGECVERSFAARAGSEEALQIDWNAVVMVAVAPLDQAEPVKADPKPLRRGPGPILGKLGLMGKAVHAYLDSGMFDAGRRAVRPPILIADIFVQRPPMIVRILSDSFNYAYLGDRATGSATRNFRSLIADVGHFAPRAELPPITRDFLLEKALERWLFKDMNDLDRYHRWLYLCYLVQPT